MANPGKPAEVKRKLGSKGYSGEMPGSVVVLPAVSQVPEPLSPLSGSGLDLWDRTWLRGFCWLCANTDIQLQPSGTGDVVFGTDAENADASRIGPAAILGPILEHNVEKDPSTAEITYDRTWPVVTQRDIGYDADEIPVSGLLGQLAFTDSAPSVTATQSPPLTNELTFEVSGTTLTIKYQPTGGGAVQTTTLTLS